MKRLVLLVFIAFLGLHTAVSQCVPDQTITQPGIYPDSLPSATVGDPYSQTLQVRVLTDTTINGQNATINSIQITSIAGVPANFTYQCVPANCTFPGGGNGCIVFTGTAQPGQAGQYPLTITLDITATIIVFGVPATITQTETMNDYTFVINDPVSVQNIKSKTFELQQNFPNPAIDITSVEFTLANAMQVEFRLYDVLGKELKSKIVDAKPGLNTLHLDVRDLENGFYMYSVKAGSSVLTRRMAISRKQ